MSDALPADLMAISARVGEEAERFLGAERDRWRSVDPELDALLAALERAVLAGGKRIRPALCHWGWRCGLADRDDEIDAEVARAGLAFELLHAFALVHDDVMDDAATRRGVPTTHVHFERAHARAEWRGETRRFGESIAILVGDLAHVYADQLMADMPPPTRELWRQMKLELVAGQYLDVLGTVRGEVTEPHARLIAQMKSGRYTIVAPLRVGASLLRLDGPRAAAALDDTLVAYGEPLGTAFQLRDDVLGTFGDPKRLGKPVGADLSEGKPTVLLAAAWARADRAQRASLARVGRRDLSEAEVGEIQETVLATGALAVVEDEIGQLTDQAVAVIERAPLATRPREALVSIARFVATRQH